MAKRFVDTEIWNKAWYQELSIKEKILVKYIFEQCDCAGVWDINFRLASFIIGETVSIKDINSINEKNLLFEIFDNDKIFVIDFIKFQYGSLSENCKPHKPVIEKLKKYNLIQRVFKGYSKGIETLEEKEKEKEQLKEKEIIALNPNFNYSDEKTKLFEIYKSKCPNLTKITFEDRNNDILGLANRFLEEIRYDFDYYERLCIKANTLRKIVDKTINFKMLIKNHIGIMNGDYEKKTEIDERTQAILACFRGGNNG